MGAVAFYAGAMRRSLALALSIPGAAAADAPAITVSARNTTDVFDVAGGGVRRGVVVLNKAQVSATLRGERIGAQRLRLHAQLFRTDGASLSARASDTQTASNIEAVDTVRLFEAWGERGFGADGARGSLRVGLIDFNGEFDSIEPASLFVNSSHGIGPDISKSGRAGPSIFPVSSLAARLAWSPSERWVLRAAVFDGVPGDPAQPRALAAIRLRGENGALLAAEADWLPAKDIRVAVGGWHYTERLDRIDGRGRSIGSGGLYGYAFAPLTRRVSGWVRAGIADANVQAVGGYLGAGVVALGFVPGRPHDQLGLAIAHAITGRESRALSGLPGAETTIEATWQARLTPAVTLQPDVQYIHRPAAVAGTRDAVLVGLRIGISLALPRATPAAQAADPNTPPDAPDAPPRCLRQAARCLRQVARCPRQVAVTR